MSIRGSLSKSLEALGKRVASGESSSPDPVREEKIPGWVIALTCIGAVVLLIVGVLVLVAGRDMWQHPGKPQVSHPIKATLEVVKAPVKVVKKNGATHRKLSTIKRVKTVERLGRVGERSETVTLAILATGAALLLAGGFAARLTKLKLPGVEMSAQTLSALREKAKRHVTDNAKKKGKQDILQDNEKLDEAVDLTVLAGLEGKTRTAAAAAMGAIPPPQAAEALSLNEEKLQKAAEVAVQTVSEET